jgi:nucleosome binding factor SPN SPT16 subunit
MSDIFRNIQDLKKNAVKREAERKEMEDVVEQENLREIRNRRPQRLLDLFARPTADNKRVPGELEIHENGLRYQTAVRSDSRIDLLFNNIRHVFFQPNDSELVTIIHVHLKNPIMVGKRKTKDVQFYREVTDAAVDETGNRKRKYRYGDDDEHEQEAEERRRRAAMNKEFKEFAQKIADAVLKLSKINANYQSNGEIQVDIPFRNLGFNGVPFRSNVLLQPSTECLVNLTETPFLVVTLADIEIVHLERVQFGLKNFDMVMIFKDFHRTPVHINSIPMEHLDNVKSWLDSCDIAFSEGPLNLNWTTIMKTVNEDPAQFFKDGGWKFLEVESDDESDQSESASEFEMSEEEFEEESEEDESDFDDDASDDDGSDADEDESGEDWSEMEEEGNNPS